METPLGSLSLSGSDDGSHSDLSEASSTILSPAGEALPVITTGSPASLTWRNLVVSAGKKVPQ